VSRPAAATEEDAFLRTILEHPDDDMARLVFADWLEERGDPRGPFIRLQCQRAGLTHHDPGFKELLAQESALFKQHHAEWMKPVQRLVDEVEFRRGFIAHVGGTVERFLKNADRLLRLAPIQSVKLTQIKSQVQQLSECPQLAKVRALILSQNSIGLGSRTLQTLMDSPFIGQLTELRLFECALGPASAAVLASAPALGQLQTLILGRNSLGAGGARLLAESGHLARLRELSLFNNVLLREGAQALADAPSFRLQRLDLGLCGIGNEGIAALAKSPASADLRHLDLPNNAISNVGVLAIVNSPHLTRLEHLNLLGNRISDHGVQALADTTTMPNLAYLNLEANEFGPAAAQVLARSMNFPRMRQLLLGRHGDKVTG
jgi:uncharacterized protein (TIGR02996 family)